MNDRDHELFEAELRKLTPARPPAELMARLSEAPAGLGVRQSAGALLEHTTNQKRQRAGALQDAGAPDCFRPAAFPQPSALNPRPLWRLLLRWLVPATMTAALVAVLVAWWPHARKQPPRVQAVTAPPKAAPGTEEVEIDRQLVALFDTVAKLPSGEPVRFRCREWTDEVVLRDPARGLVIERHTPRLEVVPVSIETF
jgi:hypothetical protein